MQLFTFRRQNPAAPSRTPRRMRPMLDSFEPRVLMSGATISGTATRDLTGNGFSAGDTPLANVTVDLYKSGSSAVFESARTASNGGYSFSNLSAGSYSVQQVVPSGDLATGGINGYSVSLKSEAAATNQNFDDFKLPPQASLSGVSFVVTTPAGKSTTVSTLLDNVQQGDTVKAKFNLATAEQMTLVAYNAPNGDFNTSNLQQQTIFSQASTNGGTGAESLTVTAPDGYFQIDFVAGPAIDHLEGNANITYHAQDRFYDGDDGGSQPDGFNAKVAAPPAAATPTVTTASKMVAAAVSAAPDAATMSKMSKMSKMIAAADVVVATDTLARKH